MALLGASSFRKAQLETFRKAELQRAIETSCREQVCHKERTFFVWFRGIVAPYSVDRMWHRCASVSCENCSCNES